MEIYWLEQRVNDVPFGDQWLSGKERSRLDTLQIPKRRSDWRLGRWTAKSAVAMYLGLTREAHHLAELEIQPAPSGAPEIFLRERPAPVALSLSHSHGVGMCIVTRPGADVGCDLEKVESRSPAFLTDYFTEWEQKRVAQTAVPRRALLLTLAWSAKESALKAMRCGLREDTRCLHTFAETLESNRGEWQRLTVDHAGGASFSGWWRESGRLVRTILVSAAENVVSLHAISDTAPVAIGTCSRAGGCV